MSNSKYADKNSHLFFCYINAFSKHNFLSLFNIKTYHLITKAILK